MIPINKGDIERASREFYIDPIGGRMEEILIIERKIKATFGRHIQLPMERCVK